MKVNDFEILLIDVTFYLWHVQKLAFIVLIKNEKNEYNRDRWLKGLIPYNWGNYIQIRLSDVTSVSTQCNSMKTYMYQHTEPTDQQTHKKRPTQISGLWLVEMAISTNHKPDIWVNCFENTEPPSFFIRY